MPVGPVAGSESIVAARVFPPDALSVEDRARSISALVGWRAHRPPGESEGVDRKPVDDSGHPATLSFRSRPLTKWSLIPVRVASFWTVALLIAAVDPAVRATDVIVTSTPAAPIPD